MINRKVIKNFYKKHCNKCIVICVVVFVIYVILYNYYIKYIANIHELTDKNLIKHLWDIQILGATDKNYMKLMNDKNADLNFWYTYNYAITENEVIFFLISKVTKYTKYLNFRSYSINLQNHTVQKTNDYIDFSLLKTYKEDDKLFIHVENKLLYIFDIENNKIGIKINIKNCNVDLEYTIKYWNTTQISFIQRFFNLRHLPVIGEMIDGQASSFDNEWCIDNPFVGTISYLKYNNQVYNEGTFWIDTYIANNNYIMRDYIWHVINNDEWLIYLLWYCDDMNFNKNCTKVIYIIDIKTNTIIHSGIVTNYLERMQNIHITYNSGKKIGDEKYDDYNLKFKSDKIEIEIDSIHDKSNMVEYIKHLYLPQMDEINDVTYSNEQEKQYYDEIHKLNYCEYVNYVNFTVKYNNQTHNYKDKIQIIDACFS